MTHTINGTNGNDTINGTSKDDYILAKAGNDVITAGNGDDRIDGGAGNDTISAGNDDDDVNGGSGNDIINGDAGNDVLDGDDGNDTIDGGSGNDLIDGDDGNDILKGGAGLDAISGGDGDDTITGGSGNDLIYGGRGTDTAIFSGTYASYDILNLFGLVAINGQDGTDLVLDVEYLKFDDGIYNVENRSFTPNQPATLVSITATDGSGTEAVDGTDFTYTFTRTGNLSQALTVNYTIVPAATNGATPGADIPTQTGTITFAAGSATATLQFNAIDDAVVENTESFSVVLGAGAGYQVNAASGSANGSIIDNDFPPAVVSLTPATVSTTEGGTLTFTFTRTGGNLAGPLTINYVVNDGGPLGGATRADGDFSYPGGMQSLTFAAGQAVASITVQTNADTRFEGDESFPVLLAGGLGYTVDPANNASTGVIVNDDPAPLVSVAATDGIGTETVDGTDFAFTFSRTGDTSQALTVNYGVFAAPIDGATPGVDFPAQSGTITFAAGSATAVLAFDALPDAVIENTELFSVVVGVGAGYQVDLPNASAGASIIDGTITLTEDPDSFVGTSSPEAIRGLGGNDSIDGGAGDDAIFGGGGDDGLAGGLGNDFIDGGAGFDRALYTNAGAAVTIMLAAGTATIGTSVDTLRSIEFGRGTAHADTYDATGYGLPGAANFSSDPSPTFNGFEGLNGNDTITGNGNTRVEYATATAAVFVDLQLGTAHALAGDAGIGVDTITLGVAANNSPLTNAILGSSFGDQLFGTDNFDNAGTPQFETVEVFRGGAGADLIDGRGGGDRADYSTSGGSVIADFRGGANAGDGFVQDGFGFTDTLFSIEMVTGGNNNDFFYGSAGKNVFQGNGGNDWFDGGIGNDDFTGGAGADTYAFTAAVGQPNADAIHDFDSGLDKIAFSTSIYGNAMLPGGGVRMVNIGDPMTSQATFIYNPNPSNPGITNFDGHLMFDPDGSGVAAAQNVLFLVDDSEDLVLSDLIWINDGPPPTPAVVSVRTGDSGPDNVNGTTSHLNEGSNLLFTFTRTGDLTNPLTITYSLPFNFEAQPEDILVNGLPTTAGNHTLTFAAGSSTATLNVTAVLDAQDEGPQEGFFPFIQSGPDYTLGTFDNATQTWTGGPPLAQVFLHEKPVISVREANSGPDNVNGSTTHVTEGNDLHFIFSRTGDVSSALTITYDLPFNFEAQPDDVLIGGQVPTAGSRTVTFAAGSSTATLDIEVVEDGINEGPQEGLFLFIQGSPDYALGTFDNATQTWIGGPPLVQAFLHDF